MNLNAEKIRADHWYVKSSDQISVNMDDDEIILNIDQGVYYALNRVARTIWDAIERPVRIGEIIRLLCEAYDVSGEEAEKAVVEFLGELSSYGLLRKADPPVGSG